MVFPLLFQASVEVSLWKTIRGVKPLSKDTSILLSLADICIYSRKLVVLPIDWHYVGPIWRTEAEFISREYFPSMLLEAQGTMCFLFLETGL